ncbi:LLM class flavin-dependent oxidoreductase [Marinicrinis sediminis]|uniref:LLM class flavin-dependent oxidoreductase n=1 Tax=Marinicrinis sediminis TaxID=1652465 RepID=A0ABW5REV1_9BACL
MVKLSILDQSPIAKGLGPTEALQQTTRLVQEAEKLGYHRFWVSEHHHTYSLAGSSPEVLIPHLAAKTERIRLGSGGVMLPHYSAYKVAENFQLLEALYPKRIDLGIGRAPGGMPIATRALQEGKPRGVDLYPQQIDDLLHYIYQPDEQHRFADLKATPLTATQPELWMLGSSYGSAGMAAAKGAAFAFAQFINGDGGIASVHGYQEQFRPSAAWREPYTMLAIFVICADTDAEADALASSLDLSLLLLEKGYTSAGGFPSPEEAKGYTYDAFDRSRVRHNRQRMVVGGPQSVKQQLEMLQQEYRADELMAVTITHDFEAKLHSYRLLAEQFGLEKAEISS